MDLKSKIILISGPTASGKSKFAIKLAKKIGGEIINADSMQIFKEIKILNARPRIKDKSNIKHHLYGFLSVKKNFSVGDWLKKSLTKISEIKKRKKVPIIVGGTGLYFKSLVDGLAKIPKISKRNRDKVRNLQKKIGQKSFYKKLIKLDPLCKNNITININWKAVLGNYTCTCTKFSGCICDTGFLDICLIANEKYLYCSSTSTSTY